MKIVKAGKVVEREIWWKGRRAECSVCGATIELEGNEVEGSGFMSTARLAHFDCQNPACAGMAEVKRHEEPDAAVVVVWDSRTPRYESRHLHKYTIVESVELASFFLDTDYTKETETLFTGKTGRVYLTSISEFVSMFSAAGTCQTDDQGRALIGMIGHRKIVYVPAIEPSSMELVNDTTKKSCKILIEDGSRKPKRRSATCLTSYADLSLEVEDLEKLERIFSSMHTCGTCGASYPHIVESDAQGRRVCEQCSEEKNL